MSLNFWKKDKSNNELKNLKKQHEDLLKKHVDLQIKYDLYKSMAVAKEGIFSKEKEIMYKLVERVNDDNIRYKKLQDFILSNFPELTQKQNGEANKTDVANVPQGVPKTSKTTDLELSSTLVGEDGRIWGAYHVVDLTIVLMSHLQKRIKDILGDNSENNELF